MDVRLVAGAVVVVLVLAGTAFAVTPSTGTVRPVDFDETLTMGMTGVDVQAAEAAGYQIPRAEVFYGQFQYVVGYYGVDSVVSHLGEGLARRQFGQPLAVFVSDFAGSDPFLTPDGFLDVRSDPEVGWVGTREASFVVGSGARTPAGPAVVPFGERDAARSFADEFGGRVVAWPELGSALDGSADVTRAAFERAVRNRSAWADRQVNARERLRERPVSVVVGEDAPTLAAAVDRAPPDTTVRLPPGHYRANVTVAKPLTIRGAGAATVLDGGGNGTAVTLATDRTAVVSLAIENVGPRGERSFGSVNVSRFRDRTMAVYGQSDAGVTLASATASLVADVRIETPASGVVARYSDRAVVRNVTVHGSDRPEDGLMGVMPMYSRVVVEDSTLVGGRDGVYTHRADGSVVRDNRMTDMRFGVHEMFTSGLLMRNNTALRTQTGVMLMTRPRNNLVVGNEVRASDIGVLAVGGTSYVAGNVVVGNGDGLTVGTTRSLVVENTAVGNDVGLKAGTIMPTNRVAGNDVADNDAPVDASGGPVHVWTTGGEGNYWGAAPGLDHDGDGTLDRPFHASDPVDVVAGRTAGGPTLARSPALALVRGAQGSVPGLRERGVVDLAPRAEPSRPGVLAEVRNRTDD